MEEKAGDAGSKVELEIKKEHKINKNKKKHKINCKKGGAEKGQRGAWS